MTDEAKAVAEVAKLGQEITKAGVSFGGYIAGVVGTIPRDLLGIIGGDWVSQQRQRNMARMQDKTVRLIEQLGQDRLTEASPSLVLPLLQAAVDENREKLQDLWAALLANAMVDDGKRVRREFFETLKSMEPVDARILCAVAECDERPFGSEQPVGRWNRAAASVGPDKVSTDEAQVSQRNLVRLGLIVEPSGMYAVDAYRVTSGYGRLFLRACSGRA